MKKSTTRSHRFSAQIFSIFLLILLIFPIAPAAVKAGKNNNIQPIAEQESPQEGNETKTSPASDDLAPAVTFTNATSISIPDNGAATPSTINVTGLSGTVTKVTVTLNDINVGSGSFVRDLDFLLVSPDNKKFNFVSDVHGASTASNVTITLDDAAASALSESTAPFVAGTFRPTDDNSFGAGDGNDVFPFAPAGTQFSAASEGSSTFASVYNGISPNGNWTLHVIDDAANAGTQSVSGGWSIDITVSAVAVATTTNISSGTNPSFTGNAVTFTAAVTSTSTVNEGTVTFQEGASTISGCGAVAVVAGSAQCSPTFATEGTRTITATYNGTVNFNSSNDNLLQEVNNTTTVNPGNEYCNTGTITLDDSAGMNATPYPSKIFVTGLPGTISKVTVTLNNMNLFDTRETDILLVGPNGEKFIILADVGDTSNTTGATIVLDDAAGSLLPSSGGLASGTFKPTNYTSGLEPGSDVLAPPAPGQPYEEPAPTGTATFASVFNGISPNGTWQLFAEDESQLGGADGTIAGWCLTFTTTSDTPTTTVLTSDNNPAFINEAINFTATVTETTGGTPVTTGTVTFREGATILSAGVALNGSGQAVYNAPAGTFPEGSHQITADYSGDPGSFNISDDTITQIVNNVTTTAGASFCNAGAITVDESAQVTTPYPSNIIVSGLVGTFQSVTVTLNNMTIPTTRDLDILLVGPNGEEFMILSDTGDNTSTSGATIILDDAGASQLPSTGGLTSGTFQPTAYVSALPGNDIFPAPAPAGPYNFPAPEGSATFGSVFPVGTNANGTWSLYVFDDSITGGLDPTIGGGWCVTPTLTPFSTTTAQVTSDNNPAATTQNVTFTATVTAATGTPSGMVEFFEDGNSLGMAPLVPAPPPGPDNLSPSASASAQLTTSFLFAGNRNITATYNGNLQPGGGGFTGSNSNAQPLVQMVLGPTAAAVTVSGRVLSGATGRGIFNAKLTMVDAQGQVRYAITNPFGYYRFVDVEVGATYTLNVSAKNRVFNPSTRVVSVKDDLTDVNFFSGN